jgi:cell wall-associated NlpC family hydrolase
VKEWIGEYIGLPFLERGRTREGLDCWGLVRLVLEERYGKTLPLFDGYENHHDLDALDAIVSTSKPLINAQQIEAPRDGDLALMFVHNHPCHVGILVDERTVLHIERFSDSVIQRLSDLRYRVEGFYRV